MSVSDSSGEWAAVGKGSGPVVTVTVGNSRCTHGTSRIGIDEARFLRRVLSKIIRESEAEKENA
jgi:hypothetical protein